MVSNETIKANEEQFIQFVSDTIINTSRDLEISLGVTLELVSRILTELLATTNRVVVEHATNDE